MITAVLAQFLPYILGALALVGGVFGYGVKKKRDGRAAERAKAMEKRIDEMLIAKKVRDENAKKAAADVHADLGKWMRDGDK